MDTELFTLVNWCPVSRGMLSDDSCLFCNIKTMKIIFSAIDQLHTYEIEKVEEQETCFLVI